MKRYEDKVIFITGGTQGIGFGMAQRFCEEGASVIICSRREKNLKEALELLKGYKIEGHICNVGKPEERQALIKSIGEKYGRIDVLVLNVAASTHFGTQLEISERAFDKMFELNVKSTFFTIVEAREWLNKGTNPNIMVLSSVVSKYPSPTIGVYSMTKAALNSMVESLAFELMDEKIRVNGVAPGSVKTNLTKPIWSTPMGQDQQMGSIEQVAGLVSAICSDDGSLCNGEIFYCHGGDHKM